MLLGDRSPSNDSSVSPSSLPTWTAASFNRGLSLYVHIAPSSEVFQLWTGHTHSSTGKSKYSSLLHQPDVCRNPKIMELACNPQYSKLHATLWHSGLLCYFPIITDFWAQGEQGEQPPFATSIFHTEALLLKADGITLLHHFKYEIWRKFNVKSSLLRKHLLNSGPI